MNKVVFALIFLTCLILGNAGYSQTVDPPYEVGTWQGFRTAAVTFTFDDGSPNQYAKAIPLFNEFDFNLTLFLVTGSTFGWQPKWDALQSAASRGHEIASHTVTHTSLSGMSDSLQTLELQQSQDAINSHIPDRQCVTFAYPYCATGKRAISELYYFAGRTCSGQIVSRSPSNFMGISSIVCGDQGSVKTSQDFINRMGSAVNSNGWCVFLLHGIDNDGGWSPVSTETLRETLQYLQENQGDLWVSTFGNVARYIKERNAVSVTETSVQDSTITLQITDTLDNEIFNYPVTIRRPLPDGWPSATVDQNAKSVETKIVAVESTLYIQFDAVPDSGDVVISKSNTTGIQSFNGIKPTKTNLAQNYPNPFNPETTIRFDLAKTELVTLKIFDITGKEVTTLINESLPAGRHSVKFNGENLASGVYFLSLQAQDFFQCRKMLLLR